MVKIFLFFVVTLIASSQGAPSELDSQWDSKVVRGSNAAQSDAEYQVSLRGLKGTFMCGGSIIGRRTILTTAQCVLGTTLFGHVIYTNTTTLNSGGTRYEVKSFKAHPEYDADNLNNDVAVLITAQDIVLGPGVKQIKLGTSYTEGGVTATLTGWGDTSYPGSTPNDLQIIKVKTMKYEDCKAAMGNARETQICTFNKAGEGACYGDHGSPLVVNGEVVGVLSYLEPCAAGYPDVHTRVSSFSKWINENIE